MSISIDEIIMNLQRGNPKDEMWSIIDKIGKLNDKEYDYLAESICSRLVTASSTVQISLISMLHLIDQTDNFRSTSYLNKLVYLDLSPDVKFELYWTLEAAGNKTSIEPLQFGIRHDRSEESAIGALETLLNWLNLNEKIDYLQKINEIRKIIPESKFDTRVKELLDRIKK